MSDFNKLNLIDDIDGGDGPVQARFTRSRLEAEQIGLSLFRYGPDTKTPFGHHHDVQEEIYCVVGGSGRMKVGEEVLDLRQWDVIRVAPKVVRAFEAGPDGLDLVIAGGNRPPDGDGNKDEGFWD